MGEGVDVGTMDQVRASLRDRAALAGHYYRQLRESGVSIVLASMLVRDWHMWLHANMCDDCDD